MVKPIHPAASLFPLLDEVGLARLAADIKANGLRVPIILLEGKILDGRNRVRACEIAGVVPRFVDHDGSNPWRAVWSLNRERRHITDVIRLALIGDEMLRASDGWEGEQAAAKEKTRAAKSEGGKRGGRGHKKGLGSREPDPLPLPTDEIKETSRVAKVIGVSKAAVKRARAIATEPEIAEQVKAGTVKGMEGARRAKAKKIVARAHTEPPTNKYRVLYADPPWSYSNNMPDGSDGGRAMLATVPRDHYPTMSLSEICAVPVRDWIEPDAVLFLWVTSPLLEDAFQVIRSWGFSYKTSFVWDKVKHNVGHYNSVRHEFLLVCTRGACTPDVPRLFDSVVSEERTEHSVKPDLFYEIIETIYTHGRRLEMFQRRAREGWDAWGLEASNAVA